MPIDQLVPNVAVLDDTVLYWPPVFDSTGWQVGQAWERQGFVRPMPQDSRYIWNTPAGTGTSLMGIFNGTPVGRLTNAAGGGGEYTDTAPHIHFNIITEATGLPNFGSASVVPRPWRVFRVAWIMRQSVGTPTGGLLISLAQAAGTALDAYYLGVKGDGAGNWRFMTNRTAVPGAVTEAVAIPGLVVANMNLFEFEVISALGVGNAAVNLYVNNTPFLSRAFTAVGTLPIYSDWAAGNVACYAVRVDSDDGLLTQPNAEIQYGPMTFILSRYSRAGVEIGGPGG